jgi:hypothetical protein
MVLAFSTEICSPIACVGFRNYSQRGFGVWRVGCIDQQSNAMRAGHQVVQETQPLGGWTARSNN